MPDACLTGRISKQWGEIGFQVSKSLQLSAAGQNLGFKMMYFQGDDPSTDFRGMGILSLSCLRYFAKHHSKEARRALQHSYHPKTG